MRLAAVIQDIPEDTELIVVNDGSSDTTAACLNTERPRGLPLRVIHLSRNFGHQCAITAGLDHAEGDACVIIDGDLQDPPETIPALIDQWRQGYEVVHAVRRQREGESIFKKITAAFFYRLLKAITKIPVTVDSGDFRLIDRKVVLALRTLRERGRFLRGLVSWAGYRQTSVYFVREARFAGKTKFSLGRMVRFALDAITSFSVVPLQLATTLGALFSLGSFVYAMLVLYQHFFTGRTISGWSSQMLVTLFFGGVQLLFLGILGEYIGRIFEQVKERPLYLIKEIEVHRDTDVVQR